LCHNLNLDFKNVAVFNSGNFNGDKTTGDNNSVNGIVNSGYDRISLDSKDLTAVDVTSVHSGKSLEFKKKMSPDFIQSMDVNAVEVRSARKSYGTGPNAAKILQDLNMTARKGTMYIMHNAYKLILESFMYNSYALSLSVIVYWAAAGVARQPCSHVSLE